METTLRPYPEYRNSGLPWAGIIPAHWPTRRAKWLFTKMERPVRPEDETVTCFRDGVVTLRRNRRTTGFTESLKEIGYQGVRKGDLVIHAMDAFAGAVGVSDSDGKGTPVYLVCKPKAGIVAEYYARVVREMASTQYIAALAKGIRQRSTDFRYATFAAEGVPVPPPDEQKAISGFLVSFERRVNRLIRTKQRLIALLNEQKQAIIQRAVTGGMDRTVPRKHSGVDWLGDVPAHWEIVPLKRIARLKSGDAITALQFKDGGIYPVYGGNGIRGYADAYTHEGEYVLIGRQGALCGNINYAHGRFWASEHALVAALADEHDLVWFGELVRIMNLNQYSQSAAQPGLSVERIQRIRAPLPPPSEQKAIASYLRDETKGLNATIEKAKEEIALIREYRTRLIAEVVTGKLDVRGVVVPEVDKDEAGADLGVSEDDESTLDEEAVADAGR
jgi:type I restriction enzyme S subunit